MNVDLLTALKDQRRQGLVAAVLATKQQTKKAGKA